MINEKTQYITVLLLEQTSTVKQYLGESRLLKCTCRNTTQKIHHARLSKTFCPTKASQPVRPQTATLTQEDLGQGPLLSLELSKAKGTLSSCLQAPT